MTTWYSLSTLCGAGGCVYRVLIIESYWCKSKRHLCMFETQCSRSICCMMAMTSIRKPPVYLSDLDITEQSFS